MIEMDFVCVMSVEGGLLTFDVVQENKNLFVARLKKNGSATRIEVEEVQLEKLDGNWKSSVQDPEITSKLIKCIEGTGV